MTESLKWIIPQSDYSLLLQVDQPGFEQMRGFLAQFAVAEKTPEHIHTYKINAISLRNASAIGLASTEILAWLTAYCLFPVPNNVIFFIQEQMSKYGSVVLTHHPHDNERFILTFVNNETMLICQNIPWFRGYIDEEKINEDWIHQIFPWTRGKLKALLIKHGYPVKDIAWYTPGIPYSLSLQPWWSMRAYQHDAVNAFWQSWSAEWGAWVVVLACGGGKTIVGIGAIQQAQTYTLIITTTANACYQRKNELLARTTIPEEDIGLFVGTQKELKPFTITTYSMLTSRKKSWDAFMHMDIFTHFQRGLIIYDEVHVIPAPVFSYVTSIQATRRLGLTATLVREDGQEELIFGLIGPKKYDLPWKELEKSGHIATAQCTEIRVPLPESLKMDYAMSSQRDKFFIASRNPDKISSVQKLIEKHNTPTDRILIIGEYLDQLEQIATLTWIPLLTGKMNYKQRDLLFNQFRAGEIHHLILSRVANFAIDLPDANVLIEVSGLRWSRQEEAQRLWRILRPKAWDNTAHFYILVTHDTREVDFAEKRQMFLVEQGYTYAVIG
jgi:DNA excision repair protein ERCC-3